jgi:hypothetical protein
MLAHQLRYVLIACSLAVLLSMPATSEAGLCNSCGLCNLFGGGSAPCATAQTTYTPPYYATGYAPTYAYAPPAGGCSSCAPQVVQYAPYTSYRPVYSGYSTIPRPVTTYYYPTTAAYSPAPACNSCAAPVTSYYPASGCNTCSMPVTAYRPVVAFTQQVRMIPYTTYRMAYMPMTYVGYAPACTTCASPCTSSYGSCSSCGSVSYAGATTYESPACSSYQPEISNTYAAPSTPMPSSMPSSSAPIMSPAPSTENSLPKTFQDQKPAGETLPSTRDNNTSSPDSKSSSDPDPGLSPRPDTRLNSSPGPQLVDPDNRTTSLPVRQALYLVKRPAPPEQPAPVPTSSGWRESHD